MSKCGQNGINFFINGKSYFVNPENGELDPETPLVDFIRDKANLKGTKTMCREGGCGACVVTVKSKDPVTGREITRAANSCLTPILSCNGWDITTVEKLGNRKVGYHKIQQKLAQFNGTQCGFCTPGMVMNMYSLMNSKENVKVQDVNDSFDGQLCRCTGYRSIMDAFKSLAVDAPEELRNRFADIEDAKSCAGCPCGPQSGGCCKAETSQTFTCNSTLSFQLPTGQEWVQATDMNTAFENMERFAKDGKKYRVVAGNTGTGVYKHDGPYDAFLEIANIPDLKKSTMDTAGVVIGGGVTLASAIQLLNDASKLLGYEYTAKMAKHLERVANTPVRSNGTLAGNLMLKHKHNEFPSDVFLLFETVGAKINIGCASTPLKLYTLTEFINMDMNGKLIISLYLPQRKGGYYFRSFKITRRYQNSHAYVNAGFLFKIDEAQNFLVLEKPRIVFGGVNPKFIHAPMTELYLMGKHLNDEQVLKGVLEMLDKEIVPEARPPDATPEYRKTLTKSLLYKAILGIVGVQTKSNLRSGADEMEREIGKGVQTFDIEKNDWVLYKNVPKSEANAQTSGEAEFVNDIPPRPNELYGAFVLSTVANADIKSIDASEALKIPGVEAFISEKDIPGVNDFMSFALHLAVPVPEPIFAKDKVHYAGQSLGMILAKTSAVALSASKKVKVTYENIQKPTVNIMDALKKSEEAGTLEHFPFLKSQAPAQESPKHVVKGQFRMGGQYHFHMETQSCICVPKEDGMDVYSSTQWLDQTQNVIANALAIPTNSINVEVRRLGGGFGAKITKAAHVSAACAIAANTVNRPVRVVLDLETNMSMIGKRLPYVFRYEAGFDEDGKIGNLKAELLCDSGFGANEQDSALVPDYIQNTYNAIGWEIKAGYLLTDTAANTFCRGPGSTPAVACVEYIMDHIAHKLNKDPLEVRLANFLKTGDLFFAGGQPMEIENLCDRIIDEIKVSGEFESRKAAVEEFNKEHRWKKRGIALVPIRYHLSFFGGKFPVSVVIYHHDGHVAVSHAGVEMGQGINTKVAQTVAHMFEIPLEKIQVKPTNSFIGNNACFSGGSFTSEICANGARNACQILLDRMAPIKAGLEDKSWESVVNATYAANLDLSASHMQGPNDNDKDYYIWAANISEIEIDCLTGELRVVRVDITEDVGKSLNPSVDIGQIEGAYLMGQGLWTTEKLVHDEDTGQLLTNNTWEYKPPISKDVPEDFRITLLSNAPNLDALLRAKACGEPPLLTCVAILLAIKSAIAAARRDAGNDEWFQLDGPVTPEDIVRCCLTSSSQFGF